MGLLNWWHRLTKPEADPKRIPDALWACVLERFSFLSSLSQPEQRKLRSLSSEFLADKEFSGAHGLQVSDEMALAIAAQACLPVLYLGLSWYDDFRGIVVHPQGMRARREVHDDIGLVHAYTEELSGEAMEGGPVTLSWRMSKAPRPTAATTWSFTNLRTSWTCETASQTDALPSQAAPCASAGHA